MSDEYGIKGRNGKQCRERYTFFKADIIIISTRESQRNPGPLNKTRNSCFCTLNMETDGPWLLVKFKEGIDFLIQDRQLCEESILLSISEKYTINKRNYKGLVEKAIQANQTYFHFESNINNRRASLKRIRMQEPSIWSMLR